MCAAYHRMGRRIAANSSNLGILCRLVSFVPHILWRSTVPPPLHSSTPTAPTTLPPSPLPLLPFPHFAPHTAPQMAWGFSPTCHEQPILTVYQLFTHTATLHSQFILQPAGGYLISAVAAALCALSAARRGAYDVRRPPAQHLYRLQTRLRTRTLRPCAVCVCAFVGMHQPTCPFAAAASRRRLHATFRMARLSGISAVRHARRALPGGPRFLFRRKDAGHRVGIIHSSAGQRGCLARTLSNNHSKQTATY